MNHSRWAPQAERVPEKPSNDADAPNTPEPATPAVPQPATVASSDAATTNDHTDEPSVASSGLSAAAATFSPAPAWEDDLFAQTGGGEDDLFDDAAPEDESMRVRNDDDLFSDDFVPAATTQHIAEAAPQLDAIAAAPSPVAVDAPQNIAIGGPTRGQNAGRRREQKPRGGRQPRGDRQTSTAIDQPVDASQQVTELGSADPPTDAPTGPKKETVPSVRGDRQATGGIKRPKLTESELAEKMAQIQIKNASLTAAHERAEADAASFAERESNAKIAAAQREKVERRDRQQMMGEREKNRMRKLKAMDAREWDAEKSEGDFARRGKFDSKGGFAGDKADYTDGREYLYQEPRSAGNNGRGRGGRAGGRGGHTDAAKAPRRGEDEFPALPTAKAATTTADMKTPITSWAEQVENT